VSVSDEPARFRGQALPARVASGLLLAGLTLAAAWVGGWVFRGLVAAALLTALWEFLRMARAGGHAVLRGPGLVAGAGVLLAVLGPAPVPGAVAAGLGLGLMALSLREPGDRTVGLALTVFGVLYAIGLGMHLAWLRDLPRGREAVLVLLAGTWAADTGAFFVGVRFGKTPLAPVISPGKSVEGLAGGLSGCVLAVAVAAHFLLPGAGWPAGVLLGLVLGAVAPLGDLLESMMKRSFGIKDASRVIPGHGGVLDRIDSLLVTGPVAYYLIRFWWS